MKYSGSPTCCQFPFSPTFGCIAAAHMQLTLAVVQVSQLLLLLLIMLLLLLLLLLFFLAV